MRYLPSLAFATRRMGLCDCLLVGGACAPSANFSLWGGLTFSPQQNISLLPLMGFTGTIWQGVIQRRDRDQLLLTCLVSSFSRDYADAVVAEGARRPSAEHVLEVGYPIEHKRIIWEACFNSSI